MKEQSNEKKSKKNKEPFDNITLDQLINSKSNRKINKRVLEYYFELHSEINIKVMNAAHGVEVFNSIIDSYRNRILKQCSYRFIDAYRFGGLSAREIFYNPYINGEDVLTKLREKESSIITTFLRKKYPRYIFGKHPNNDLPITYGKTYEVTYGFAKKSKSTILYKSLLTKRSRTAIALNPSTDLKLIDVYKNEYIDIPDSFYFDNFLNDFCIGMAMKVITKLSYEDIIEPYIPLFSEKIINRGINIDIINDLINMGAIGKQDDTILYENIKKIQNTKIYWKLKPIYTVYFFLNKISNDAINSYYLKNNKLDFSKIIEHFIDVSMDTIYAATRKRTNENKESETKQLIVKLENIAEKTNI